MRTLSETLDAVKDCRNVDVDDLRYALLAMESLWVFQSMDLRRLHQSELPLAVRTHAEAFKRNKVALNAVPKVWLGDNIPENPEWQQRRRVALGLLDKAMKGQLPNQTGGSS